ncbi:unnamed protein product, partial [Scytosiphon promiscuus]
MDMRALHTGRLRSVLTDMAENRPPARLRARVDSAEHSDVARSGAHGRGTERARVTRRRALQQTTTSSGTPLASSTNSAGDSYSAGSISTIADHIDQVENEYVAKLSIACVLVASLAMWFALSFWWDKKVAKRRRAAASRRRRLATGGHQQQQAPLANGLLRITSSFESPPEDRTLSPSFREAGVSGGYQRDTRGVDEVVGREDDDNDDDDGRLERDEDHKRQEQEEVKEFFNPLWGVDRRESASHGGGDRRESPSPTRATVPTALPQPWSSSSSSSPAYRKTRNVPQEATNHPPHHHPHHPQHRQQPSLGNSVSGGFVKESIEHRPTSSTGGGSRLSEQAEGRVVAGSAVGREAAVAARRE